MPILAPDAVPATLPPPGSWVKFRNLASRVIQGQLQSVFSKQSRWAKRPDVETGALGVLRLRLAGADGMINGACVAVEVDVLRSSFTLGHTLMSLY